MSDITLDLVEPSYDSISSCSNGCQLLDNTDEYLIIHDDHTHFLSVKSGHENEMSNICSVDIFSNSKLVFCKKCKHNVGKKIIRCGYILISFDCKAISIGGVRYLDVRLLMSANIIKVSNLTEAINSLFKKQIIGHELMKYNWKGLTETIPADFQIEAYLEGIFSNLIISVPSGLGKTLIAMMLIKKFQELYPQKACLFIVQTQPLVEQHMKTIRSEINVEVECIKGGRHNTSAINLMCSHKACVIIGTSGALENYSSILESEIEHFGLIIFDECHHCIKKHPFNSLIGKFNLYMKKNPSLEIRLIGMSATPVATKDIVRGRVDLNKLLEKFNNPLFYYIQSSVSNKNIDYIYINKTPKQDKFLKLLLLNINNYTQANIIYNLNYNEIFNFLYKIKKILEMSEPQIIADGSHFIKIMSKLSATQISDLALLVDAFEVIFWMDYETAYEKLEKINNLKIKTDLQEIIEEVGDEIPQRIEVLNKEIMNINEKSRVLIFCEQQNIAREMCEYIRRKFPKHSTEYVVDHGDRSGMKWSSEQQKKLDEFRSGKCNILISTSVLEKGIDIPACNLVIKYSSVNSAISLIQSCGRARSTHSKFVVISFENEKSSIPQLIADDKFYHQIIKESDEISTPSEPAMCTKKYLENHRIVLLPSEDIFPIQEKEDEPITAAIFIPFLVLNNTNIEMILEEFGNRIEESEIKINKLENSEHIGFFDPNSVCIKIKFTIGYKRKSTTIEKYIQLIENFNFKMNLFGVDYQVFAKIIVPLQSEKKRNFLILKSSIGQFKNNETYKKVLDLEAESNLETESNYLEMKIAKKYSMKILFNSIIYVIFNVEKEDDGVVAYFILSNTPYITRDSERQFFGFSDLEISGLLYNLSIYNVLSMKFKLLDWLQFENILSEKRVNFSNTIIKVDDIPFEYPELPTELNQEICDIMVLMKILKTSWKILVTSEFEIDVMKKLSISSSDELEVLKNSLQTLGRHYWIDYIKEVKILNSMEMSEHTSNNEMLSKKSSIYKSEYKCERNDILKGVQNNLILINFYCSVSEINYSRLEIKDTFIDQNTISFNQNKNRENDVLLRSRDSNKKENIYNSSLVINCNISYKNTISKANSSVDIFGYISKDALDKIDFLNVSVSITLKQQKKKTVLVRNENNVIGNELEYLNTAINESILEFDYSFSNNNYFKPYLNNDFIENFLHSSNYDILKLYDNRINTYINILDSKEKQVKLLKEKVRHYDFQKIADVFDYTKDYFWKSVIYRIVKLEIISLKTCMPVYDGAKLFVIFDPTGNTLQDGEIFIQMRENNESRIIERRIVLYNENKMSLLNKNAKKYSDFIDYYNVIILPRNNNHNLKHGDLLTAIWDDELLPILEKIRPNNNNECDYQNRTTLLTEKLSERIDISLQQLTKPNNTFSEEFERREAIDNLFTSFKRELLCIKSKYNFGSIDVLIADTNWRNDVKTKKNFIRNQVSKEYIELSKKYSDAFTNLSSDRNELLVLADTWYKTGYAKNLPQFSWVIYEYLCEMKKLQNSKAEKSLVETFIDYYVKKRNDYMVKIEKSSLNLKGNSFNLLFIQDDIQSKIIENSKRIIDSADNIEGNPVVTSKLITYYKLFASSKYYYIFAWVLVNWGFKCKIINNSEDKEEHQVTTFDFIDFTTYILKEIVRFSIDSEINEDIIDTSYTVELSTSCLSEKSVKEELERYILFFFSGNTSGKIKDPYFIIDLEKRKKRMPKKFIVSFKEKLDITIHNINEVQNFSEIMEKVS